MNFRSGMLALALTIAGPLSAVPPVDEAKPYALAGVTVIHPAKNEEALLGGAPPPQAGDLLAVHLDASVEGEVVVVALHKKTGQLAHGWRPVLAVLKSWDELGLPPRGEKWVWPQKIGRAHV